MTTLTQCDARIALASSRNKMTVFNRASHTIQANPLGLKTNAAEPKKTPFGQDFLLEHCLPVHQITSAKATGKAVNPFKDLQESPQSFGFPC